MTQENFHEYSKTVHSEGGREGERGKRHRHHYARRDDDARGNVYRDEALDDGERHAIGRRERLERGTLRYLLLHALHHGSRHGYDIIKWLEEGTHGKYTPSPGTVYPTLQLLQDQGYIQAEQDGERTIYSLTENGQSELDAHEEVIKEFWTRYDHPITSRCTQPEIDFLYEELHDLQRTVKNGCLTVSQYDDREALLAMRQTLEQCRKELRNIIIESASRQREDTIQGRNKEHTA